MLLFENNRCYLDLTIHVSKIPPIPIIHVVRTNKKPLSLATCSISTNEQIVYLKKQIRDFLLSEISILGVC